jgi:hypothetical protein
VLHVPTTLSTGGDSNARNDWCKCAFALLLAVVITAAAAIQLPPATTAGEGSSFLDDVLDTVNGNAGLRDGTDVRASVRAGVR